MIKINGVWPHGGLRTFTEAWPYWPAFWPTFHKCKMVKGPGHSSISIWLYIRVVSCFGFEFNFSLSLFQLVPDYYNVITNPMCFMKIKQKLSKTHFNHYDIVEEFLADVRLVFDNCARYNSVSMSRLICKRYVSYGITRKTKVIRSKCVLVWSHHYRST